MAKPLSNKALIVLELLREGGERSCKDIASVITERTPCSVCGGTGEGDQTSRWRDESYCGPCYGRGQAHFDYSDAYRVLKQLMARHLVRRRYTLDEWGDETPMLVYEAVADGDSDDPLVQMFRAPSAEVDR